MQTSLNSIPAHQSNNAWSNNCSERSVTSKMNRQQNLDYLVLVRVKIKLPGLVTSSITYKQAFLVTMSHKYKKETKYPIVNVRVYQLKDFISPTESLV